MPHFKFSRPIFTAILLFSLFGISNCTGKKEQNDEPHLRPSVVRFEQELAQAAQSGPADVARLREKYPLFYKLLVEEMMGMGPSDSSFTADYLCGFQRNSYTDSLTRDITHAFPVDKDPLLYQSLPKAVARFKKAFSTSSPKQITTFLSGFRYQAAIDDSGALLIGLDTYLGPNYRYYSTASYIYDYQTRRMSRNYLIADALRLLIQDQLTPPASTSSLLEDMIAVGKIHFAIQQLEPGLADSILFRYTAKQASWAAQNEKDVWKYMMTQNMVYASERRFKSRFMDDGPATLELDPNSPPRLGEWIGYGIVCRYMKSQTDMSLTDLFKKSGNEIFKESGYRGER